MPHRPWRRVAVTLGLTGALLASGGCAASPQSTSGTSGGPKGKTVSFVGYGSTNQWGAYFNGVFTEKLDAEGVKVKDLTTMDPGTAVQNFNQAIAEKPDLIVTALLDTTSMAVPIQKAKQAGVPVLVFDGRPDPKVDGDVMQVVSDNVALGTAAAQNIVEGLTAQGKKSGKVFVITGTASSLVTQDRMKGFEAEMASAPQFQVVDVQDGNWDPARSGQIATQLLAKYGCSGIQAAYGMADYMALPIIASAKQAGCPVAGRNGLVVTSSNCFKAGIDAIRAGTLYGTATEDPGTIAAQTADYVLRYFNGENPPKKETVREERVTAKNVEKFAAQCSNA
ncbi:sugar ABC transporter substrate-binding protein [Cryptosporangium arvum]|jgi:ABC-type sugar transport system substrate-binding protein|uniref:ABC-type sugar transport system, periplasmic component n=1 Tax=Cryptosporangium arvum DSM 44712 TaxID=927661 RepID=A0A010ZZT5_9ACTN|nr:sugar ABC transporter substrate-binding protein [Cryptosporangium arvum]EXG82737.1 ABC-type sugar transport system, periplasmic component [Cryptosporangium arvum DSM 44712]